MADDNYTRFAPETAVLRAVLGRGTGMGKMSTKVLGWPHHGVAVEARNDTADVLVQIIDECVRLQELLAEDAQPEAMRLMAALARIQQRATSGLLLMVEQGAPVHPSRLNK